MPDLAVMTFTDPDAYHAAIRKAQVEGIVTGGGNFSAELTCIGFDRVWVQRGNESLPRVLRVACDPSRAGVFFPTDANQPPMHLSGIDASPGEMGLMRTNRRDE